MSPISHCFLTHMLVSFSRVEVPCSTQTVIKSFRSHPPHDPTRHTLRKLQLVDETASLVVQWTHRTLNPPYADPTNGSPPARLSQRVGQVRAGPVRRGSEINPRIFDDQLSDAVLAETRQKQLAQETHSCSTLPPAQSPPPGVSYRCSASPPARWHARAWRGRRS